MVVMLVFVVLTGTALAGGAHYWHRATVYSGRCDGQSNTMADGTRIAADGSLWYRGRRVDSHALASRFLPLHALVRFDRPVYGRRTWVVRDSGGAFDLYRPNCRFGRWNNPTLGYHLVHLAKR